MKDVPRFVLVLGVVGAGAAALLGGVRQLTGPKLEKAERQRIEEALGEVLESAGGSRFEPVMADGQLSYYRGYASEDAGGGLVGYAFIAKGKGYSSTIMTMVGITPGCEITRISIMSQQETPGLGARVEEVPTKHTLWEKLTRAFGPGDGDAEEAAEPVIPWFQEQFGGKKPDGLHLGSSIEGITGATITSKAVVSSVRKRMQEVCGELDAESDEAAGGGGAVK